MLRRTGSILWTNICLIKQETIYIFICLREIMQFKGFQKTSLIEYPGKIASIVWVAGCNFKCPFCYNVGLVMDPEKTESISEQIVLNHLKKTKQWIDALAVTGGEPTLNKELPEFLKKVKQLGLLIEIETNGTNPDS